MFTAASAPIAEQISIFQDRSNFILLHFTGKDFLILPNVLYKTQLEFAKHVIIIHHYSDLQAELASFAKNVLSRQFKMRIKLHAYANNYQINSSLQIASCE